MGDLVLTCTGDLSRNRRVGIELGRGRELAEIVRDMHQVAEGIRTTRAACALAAQHGVEMPIIRRREACARRRAARAMQAVEYMMSRQLRNENE